LGSVDGWLGIAYPGWGSRPTPQSPIPNPQSPIPKTFSFVEK